MSWQALNDHGFFQHTWTSNLLGSGKIQKAAIIGLSGGVWAASSGYTLSPEEQKVIVAAFKNPAQVQASGVRLAGQKFFTLQANERSLYGKKLATDLFVIFQADGCVLVKTKLAVLVAEYVAPIQGPEATPIVEGLADYLISVNY
ncbi:profilin [Melanogaster broomeanus]|nr:profilin [Melanogaster broomeanus]